MSGKPKLMVFSGQVDVDWVSLDPAPPSPSADVQIPPHDPRPLRKTLPKKKPRQRKITANNKDKSPKRGQSTRRSVVSPSLDSGVSAETPDDAAETSDGVPADTTVDEVSDPKQEPHYHVVKTNLANIVTLHTDPCIIVDAVERVHKLAVHTLHFSKLYFMHLLDTGQESPKINGQLFTTIAKVIAENSRCVSNSRVSEATGQLKAKLLDFHIKHYRDTMVSEPLSTLHLGTPLDYVGVHMATVYENNVTLHYYDHLTLFLQSMYPVSPSASKEEKSAVNWLIRQRRKFVMNGAGLYLYVPETKADVEQKETVDPEPLPENDPLLWHIEYLLPNRPIAKGTVNYDMKMPGRWQDYLGCMVYMMKYVESLGHKIYQVFPLRSEMIPKHIRLDTSSIVDLLLSRDATKSIGSKKYHHKHLTEKKDFLWERFFKTDMRYFCPPHLSGPWRFDHQIETDGVSVSILCISKTSGKLASQLSPEEFKFAPKQAHRQSPTVYLDQLQDKSKLQGLKVVGIDPGKSDLLYCASATGERTADTFRYSQKQRNAERKSKKFKRKRENLIKTTLVEGKSVEQWLAELNQFNKKTLDFEAFKAYLAKKNELNFKLFGFYARPVFRKLKWYEHINQQRSEAKMLNRFEKKFGPPEETLVVFGDWCESGHMKYSEPTKGKGFRQLFRRRGYYEWLVNEYGTSKQCYNCQHSKGVNKKFLYVDKRKPWKSELENALSEMDEDSKQVLCHGLLRCESCKMPWNRDLNAALNIQRAALASLAGERRPAYLCRPQKEKNNDDAYTFGGEETCILAHK